MTAVTAVMAQLAIPMPGGVPMTLQTLAVTLAGVILGVKRGAVSMLIYLLLGAVGVPVFSSFTGGAGVLIGPTGGFLWSFPAMALIIGYGADNAARTYKYGCPMFWFFIVLGTAINYFVGTAAFCYVTGASISAGIAACVIPFIPTAIIKAIAGGLLGLRIRSALRETN